LRLGLANIHRRGSPAGSAVFSLGLGLTALVIIVLVQANLGDMVNETVPDEAPSFFFLDLQTHQVESFQEIAEGLPGIHKIEHYPTLRGRITAIDGTPVSVAKIAQEVRWAVRGDRFLSYAAEMPADTQIVDGKWWPVNYSGDPQVSITSDIAEGFGVEVGDTLTVNVLGREVTATISSLRKVDWSSLDLNFAILLSPGVLENAPQTHIASIQVPPDQEETAFTAITESFPNVSAISTREILKNVSSTLDRIGIAFRSMAAIALFTGFLVLAGAVSADQHKRIHDAVIFKVCGATRFDILGAFAAEFLILGLISGTISAVVGSLAALGILHGLMNMTFALHPYTIIMTILTGIVLTLLLGLLGTWKALGQKPATYLRGE
jgi:putative ABC transport system permease protein